MPKVSICIPAYNQAEHLKKTIDSILRQTYTYYEIVITDDSPGTIVSDLVSGYNLPNKIKYFKNLSTLGSPENWNESIRRASGEYIKILHHDDWLNYDDSLAKYVSLLDDNPGVDFAFSATRAIDPKGGDWMHGISSEELQLLKENPLILSNNNLVGAPSTTIFRRNTELKFDSNLKWHVDIENYIRQISKNNTLAYSPESLVVTFIAEGRVSDECIGNREVEVFEYFYLFDKVTRSKFKYKAKALKGCMLRAIAICNNYKIERVQDIRNCGYDGDIHPSIKNWLFLNQFSSLFGKLYLKFLRS